MRKALSEEKSPLDACLETVLPGVHQWHLANNQAINCLGHKVDCMAETIGNSIHVLINQINRSEEIRNQQHQQLASLLELGSNVLRGNAPSARSNNNNNAPAVSMTDIMQDSTSILEQATATTVTDDHSDLERQKTYRMKPKHKSLTDLYAEWVGEGDFMDEFGGIEGRNKRFGAKWRRHLVPYIYSRTERSVKGIRAFAQQQDIPIYDACERLQDSFVRCKYSVANLVSYFISAGLLTKKKPRGKINNETQ
jgi:Transcriptional activator of glycolytic enzymes